VNKTIYVLTTANNVDDVSRQEERHAFFDGIGTLGVVVIDVSDVIVALTTAARDRSTNHFPLYEQFTQQRHCRLRAGHIHYCSPWRKSLSYKMLEDQFRPTSPCPWTTKSLKIIKDFALCKLSVMYDRVTSINSAELYRHRAWGYGEECLTYWCQILLTDIMSASKYSSL